MVRPFVGIAVAVLCIALAGCGGSGTGGPSDPGTEAASDVDSGIDAELTVDTGADQVQTDDFGADQVQADDFDADVTPPPAAVQAGAAKASIDPVFEPYTDTNGNGHWDAGEPYEDKNKNNSFDTLYMGGFGFRHPTGSHDTLWARSVALRLGGELYVFTALDTVGLSLKRSDAIKAKVAAALTGERTIDPRRMFIASIHTHQAPDTVGIFAPDNLAGWDESYLRLVVDAAAASIIDAVASLEPAHLRVTRAEGGADLVRDIDPPVIIDSYVGIMQAVRAGDGTAIATMVSIANHPEAAWGDNTLLSADYPFYLRQKVESNLGGMAVYFSSDLGLMQTPVEVAPAGFERAKQIGETYADRVLAAVGAAPLIDDTDVAPTFGWGTVTTVLQNFWLATAVVTEMADGFKDYLKVVDDGGPCSEFGCIDLPLPVLRLGSLTTVFCVPAELTPELVVGGIVKPDTYESVYPDAPPEKVLKDYLKTPDRFLIGLCTCDVGYLYPKITYNMDAVFSQQHGPGEDAAATYLNGLTGVLAEVNSLAGD
jgi:hypothetical protein